MGVRNRCIGKDECRPQGKSTRESLPFVFLLSFKHFLHHSYRRFLRKYSLFSVRETPVTSRLFRWRNNIQKTDVSGRVRHNRENQPGPLVEVKAMAVLTRGSRGERTKCNSTTKLLTISLPNVSLFSVLWRHCQLSSALKTVGPHLVFQARGSMWAFIISSWFLGQHFSVTITTPALNAPPQQRPLRIPTKVFSRRHCARETMPSI